MMAMKLVIATVLQLYLPGLAPGQREAAVEPLLVLRPWGGLRMTLSKPAEVATAGAAP
jgi:hypothetical protein